MNSTDWIFDFSLQAQLSAGKKRFNLDVNCQSQARRLAIIGPSGSGKSLTLQLLAGLLTPEHGYVRIDGQTYGDTAQKIWLLPQQRQVGLMFQDYALFPHLTVAQNIAFGLQHGWHNPSNRNPAESVLLWLERMQLQHISGHYPHQISGGQKQRTALARACITRPKWLLLDEPFSALDADLRQQMRQLVGELQSELSVPMLIISHDSADTQALADEVLYMENGRLKG
ncbi:MAG: ATP-binding cassette domain-containing protein [Neisseria sp.]|nr:MAG: ATP-binding cassette domain-containing protein [Neisseria sp.]